MVVELKGTIQVDVMNLQQVKDAIEIMQEVVHDDRIPVEIRTEYKERFDAIKWELPTETDIDDEFKETSARMHEVRERMNNKTRRLIGHD